MKLHRQLLLFLFVTFLNFYSISQNLNWVRHYKEQTAPITGTYHEQFMNGFDFTSDGGMVTYGNFEDDVDFDPGPGQVIVDASSIAADGYIVKLNALGEFEWEYHVSGATGTEITDIDIDEAGNIYATGSCRGGTIFGGSGASWDMFVVKLDPDGNFMWGETYGDVLEADYGSKISVKAGKLYVAGIFGKNVNLDPNYTNASLTFPHQMNFVMCMDTNTMYNWIDHSGSNGYKGIVLDHNDAGELFYGCNSSGARLKKYDPSGNVLMDVDWGNNLYFEGMSFDDDGGIYLAGRGYNEPYTNTLYDIDPGPNQKIIHGGIFYLRLDANGNFYLGNWIGGNMWNTYVISSAYGIDVDYQKNVYISGSFRQSLDFDPNPLTSANLSAQTFIMDGFVARYDSLGNYVWAYDIGNSFSDFSKFIRVDDDLNVTNCGGFNCTVDFDPSASVFNLTSYGCTGNPDWFSDSYIQQIKQDSCDHLSLIIDTIAGMECSSTGFVTCHGLNSEAPYLYSWNGEPFSPTPDFFPDVPGSHTVWVQAANGCQTSRTVQVNGPVTSAIDVQVNCVPGAYIPGVNSSMIINAFNGGCTLASGEIIFIVPQLMDFDSSSVVPDYINGDTLIWYYSNFDYQTPHFVTKIFYSTDTVATIGDSISFPLSITPMVDYYSPNNDRYYHLPVVNSYDPNNKSVYPQGDCIPHYISTNDRLTYSVNFQNTGTSDAIDIYLLDMIDPDLDISTLRILGSSHAVETEILPGNLVKFRHDNIYLPDSASNEQESKGYIIFELDQNAGLANNTEIKNAVGIYFDYNAPIITNTVFNTVIDVTPNSNYLNTSVSACDSLILENNTYTSSGSYLLDLQNQFGCDSLVNLNLTINHSNSAIAQHVSCGSYTWIDGNTYATNNNTATYLLSTAAGCDSMLTLDLIVYAADSATLVQSACDEYTWAADGTTYTSSGIYTKSYSSVNSCDSLAILDLTVKNSTFSMDIVTTCNSFTWLDGNTYNGDNNTATHILINAVGCDSIITLNLTMNYVDNTTTQLSEISFKSNEPDAEYQWVSCESQGSYLPVFGETSQFFIAMANGEYAVIVTKDNCTDTSACLFVSTVGLADNYLSNAVQIIPNPNNGQFKVGTSTLPEALVLFDISGRLIEVLSPSEEIKLQSISAGTYYLQFTFENEVVMKKIIIE